MPWTVHQYLAGEVLRLFLLGVFGVSLFYTTLAAYQSVRSGLQISFIWPLLARTFAYPLYFSIPIALLFAITLAVGRLVGDLEVTALRAHGISTVQIYIPVLGLGLVLAAASFYLNGWVVPGIHYEKRNLQAYILDQLENLGSGVNRTILLPDDEGILWVGAYDGGKLQRVRVDLAPGKGSTFLPAIREHLPDRLPSKVRIYASEGQIEIQPDRRSVVLNLHAVEVLVPEAVRGSNEIFHQKFAVTQNVLIPLSFLPKPPGTKDRTIPDLLRHIEELEEESAASAADGGGAGGAPLEEPGRKGQPREASARKIASAVTELHRRMAFTLSCLTFPLVGVSLALLLHRWSRLVPFFFGNLVVILLYYPLLMVGVALGDRGIFPALSLALPNVALLALGVWLSRKGVQ